MALRKRGKWWYGSDRADIRQELARYGACGDYVPTEFADAVCACGSDTSRLLVDDNEGAAVRVCQSCHLEHPVGDSNEYLADAELEEATCPCGGNVFQLAVGLALYEGSEDVRWLYIGGRCPSCGLTACYADWKNEFSGFRELLARV